jgi:hypothetical protein
MPGLEPGIQGNNAEQAALDRRVKPGDDELQERQHSSSFQG